VISMTVYSTSWTFVQEFKLFKSWYKLLKVCREWSEKNNERKLNMDKPHTQRGGNLCTLLVDPLYQRNGKGGQTSGQFKNRGGNFTIGASSWGYMQVSREDLLVHQLVRGQVLQVGWQSSEGLHIHYVQMQLKAPWRLSTTLKRCYICRGEGHQWRGYKYLGRWGYYYGDTSHRKKKCPRRNVETT
jgi:hypothetical protein